MRHVRFRDSAGYVRTGNWTDDGIEYGEERYDPEVIDVLPPVEPTKIVCVAANYVEHLRESGMSIPEDLPDRPSVFLKGPNAVAGHGDTIELPTPGIEDADAEDSGDIEIGAGRIDYEAELGVVIGEQCKYVGAEDVNDVIAGYTCVNDISNRDDQREEQNWVRGKAFDGAAPIGPVVASPEMVPEDPRIQLRLNDKTKQDSSNDEFIFSVSDVITEVTKFLTFEPGDVIAMGTTYGVGPLADGDTVEIEIEGIGTLVHDVAE